MASGQRYHAKDMVAAHKSFPFGTKVMIYTTKDTVVVTITDRGKLHGRTFDLSQAAFKKLAPLSKGVIKVSYEKLN